ncbi:MAG: EAL domain-containing protein [Thiobacillus sp.]|nr:EAL domain-containing protein [Thiobacillus sp.]
MSVGTHDLPQELAAIVLENIRDGMMVTDADNRILYVNEAFCEVTGYALEEVLGQTPSMLKSGRHGPEFYARMWHALKTEGRWQGEIWDRRKSGEVYLERLSITVVKDGQGEHSHHVAVFTDIDALHSAQERLQRIAHFDILTELPNRAQLTERLHKMVERARRDNQLLALVFLDLDGFKLLNDRHGHAMGDRILVMVAQRLKQVVRSTDVVARLGGDEFAMALSGLPNMDEIECVAERVLSLSAAPFEIDGQQYTLTASLGVTVFPFDSADTETLLRHADQAMYQAKQAGRNRFHLFDAEQDQQAQTRRQLLHRLGEALGREELVLHYQPKVNLRTGQVMGMEALLRWQHPERGLLSPGEFLPQAEHDELIVDIGEWVTRKALSQIMAWDRMGCALSISVNLAARQLLRKDFVDCVRACLNDYPEVKPGRLEMEILESAALENTRHVREVIEACREMGVGFALDDFGTGYASLAYLRDIPADVMKIDQSFVRDILEDSDDLTLVEGVIGLATAFRRTVVAEGVETAEQGVLLMRLGCDIVQGYGISRPMPAEDVPAWVAAYRPDPQWALWADTQWEMNDFPLLVAQYDHVKWVKGVLDHLEGASLQLSAKELSDHHQCRFGHWYYGHGSRRYGQLQAFVELEPIHAAVHRLGPEIIRLRQAGDMETARAKVRELMEFKDQILEKLADLQACVAGQP